MRTLECALSKVTGQKGPRHRCSTRQSGSLSRPLTESQFLWLENRVTYPYFTGYVKMKEAYKGAEVQSVEGSRQQFVSPERTTASWARKSQWDACFKASGVVQPLPLASLGDRTSSQPQNVKSLASG